MSNRAFMETQQVDS